MKIEIYSVIGFSVATVGCAIACEIQEELLGDLGAVIRCGVPRVVRRAWYPGPTPKVKWDGMVKISKDPRKSDE